ncbi:hypothetical protein niasHT_029071 [Heterodera trifolii]|uniref:Coiled-coil domain-containing protein 93 n=1 Tax=Heterodera trifolii TaxID=157864 RepID=A0ABD2KST2_9BILA
MEQHLKQEEKVMDDEQLERLSQTLELLFSAGYFRAKIMGLGNFDKIVGGMVWCISQCAHKVDVDLLYSDNQTIGQKIALTERIVKVLPELSCPFSLEPHQIQGLDLEHIYPVVQWLVNEANFVRERLGNETLNFAVYQFGQQGWHFSEQLECIDSAAGVRPLVKRRPRKVYRRVKRMADIVQPMVNNPKMEGHSTDDDLQQSRLNLAKNGDDDDDGERLIVMEAESAEIDGQQRHDGIAGQMPIIRMVYKEQQNIETSNSANQQQSLEELERELEALEIEEANLAKSEAEEGERSAQLVAEFEQLDNEEQEQQKAYETHGTETVEQLRTLLAQRDAIKADESAFKAQCRQRLDELDTQIERLEQCEQNDAADEGTGDGGTDEIAATNAAAAQALHDDGMARARALAAEVGATNRQIVRLSRRLGARPSRVELAQYQRKFVELCNQISAKHGETKRQYTLYNTLVSKRDFIQREIRLLNSIDDQRELAQREEYRDSLLDNLQQIGRGVDDSLDKMLCKRRMLQEQRDQLHNQLQMLLDKQRMYMKTVGEFQQACQRNEQLREALENNGQNETAKGLIDD